MALVLSSSSSKVLLSLRRVTVPLRCGLSRLGEYKSGVTFSHGGCGPWYDGSYLGSPPGFPLKCVGFTFLKSGFAAPTSEGSI